MKKKEKEKKKGKNKKKGQKNTLPSGLYYIPSSSSPLLALRSKNKKE